MLLGAKGPPLPTIKNGLETLRRRLPTVFHGHAWSWVVLVVEVVLDSGGVGGLGAWVVLGCLGWCWVISKLRKVTLKKAKKAHVSEANAELMDVDMCHGYRLIMPFRCLRWVYHLRGLGGVM